jgi:Amt family ammonium transporter
MVAGLATITPAAGSVGPEGALLIGLMAGTICFYATQAVKGVFGIDDSLDVFPVHGVGGIIGIIMVSFLGVQGGFLGSSAGETWTPMEQFLIQMKGIAVIGIWTGIASWSILKLISSLMPLRVTEEEEYEGLDIAEHEERGYDLT